jgi:hypothetical protein
MCVSALNSCTYAPGDEGSIVFEVTIVPDPDSAVRVTRLSFFEKAPTMYDWIGGASGPNNYPTRFGVRILKNGSEIFVLEDLTAVVDVWTEEVFDFTGEENFNVVDSSTFRIELLPYCLIGNGAAVAAWDVDEVKLSAECEAVTNLTMDISGAVRNSTGTGVNAVMLQLAAEPKFVSTQIAMSDSTGRFAYDRVYTTDTMYLRGYKNTGFLNGVTTLDLVYIQKHLLGLELLQSPYQMIAADINHSESVSVLDLVELRELLLGRIESFRDNTSWRFGLRDQELSMDAPWDFEEVMKIPKSDDNFNTADFIAVKIGDVTGSALPGVAKIQVRSNSDNALKFITEDAFIEAGSIVQIDVTCANFNDVTGFQFALRNRDLTIIEIQSGATALSEIHHFIDRDGICRISWYNARGVTISPNEVLFRIKAIPSRSGHVRELLQVATDQMSAEAYRVDGTEIVDLSFEFENAMSGESEITFEIEPNPISTYATLKFTCIQTGDVRFDFYDLNGVLLYELSGVFDRGSHALLVDRSELPSPQSVIVCQMISGEGVLVRKLMLSAEQIR